MVTTRGAASLREASRRIKQLREQIRRHDYAYYVRNRPLISDASYDALLKRLERLEAQYPRLVSGTSPTQRVAGAVRAGFTRVRHPVSMLSLQATRDPEEVRAFLRRVHRSAPEEALLVEPKLDGVSIELTYRRGSLVQAATRGDGSIGEGVLENVRTIPSVPLVLRRRRPAPGVLVIRGEVLIGLKSFERLNRELLARGEEPFANPRNAAAGSLRQLDPRVTARRPLQLIAYEIVGKVPGVERDQDALRALAEWGFATPPVQLLRRPDEVLKYHQRMQATRDRMDHEIDGIVLKLDRLSPRSRMGSTSHHPRWALAFKFAPRMEVTRIENIAVQVGRTGAVTPVALLRPVDVGGVTVSRATLHNPGEVARRDLRVGDLVRLQRAGDVIPEVVSRIGESGRKRRPPFRMPRRCPACRARLVGRGSLIYCPNRFQCPAQSAARLVHFAGGDALDIEGMGPETVSGLIAAGLVREPADLFALAAEDLLKLPGFGPRKATKLVAAIQTRKRPELGRMLYSLGIPGVGRTGARDLAAFFGTLPQTRDASLDDLYRVPGVGSETARAIRTFFADRRNRAMLDRLRRIGVSPVYPARTGPLRGKTIVFTGGLKQLTRKEARERVEALGGRVAEAISGRTDLVVVGKAPGAKLDQARRLKVAVLDEPTFLRRLAAWKRVSR